MSTFVREIPVPGDRVLQRFALKQSRPVFDPACPLCRYTIHWARHPDPGSEFAGAVEQLLELQDDRLFELLMGSGYEGLIYLHAARVVGHSFCQVRDGGLHLFSMFLVDDLRGQQISGPMLRDLMGFTRDLGLGQVRLGKGLHPKMQSALRFLERHAEEYAVEVLEDGYVRLC